MSLANNVIQLKVPIDNLAGGTGIKDEVILDADYFGYSQTINITELLKVLQESNIKKVVDNSEK